MDDINALNALKAQGINLGEGRSNGDNADKQRRQAEDQNDQILDRALDKQARERLRRIKMANPERAAEVSSIIAQLWRSGPQMSDTQLVGLLDQIEKEKNKNQSGESRIKFQRKNFGSDSEDDDYGATSSIPAPKHSSNRRGSDSDSSLDI